MTISLCHDHSIAKSKLMGLGQSRALQLEAVLFLSEITLHYKPLSVFSKKTMTPNFKWLGAVHLNFLNNGSHCQHGILLPADSDSPVCQYWLTSSNTLKMVNSSLYCPSLPMGESSVEVKKMPNASY